MEEKKAVIYCRVSTKEQVDEGNSLVTQEKNCRDYAQKQGYEIVAVFIEQGESAKTADRTELKKLMSFCAAKKHGISAVISYKIDRISRNTDDYSQIRILLKRYGVEIKSTSEHFENTPAGRFMENIIANVAQFDNDVRAERCIGGMKEAVREGRYVWMAPYGYSNVRVNGKATIAPNHLAPLVKKAFKEIALNNRPVEEIREEMIRAGLKNSQGRPISRSNFYYILKLEVYTGWINKFGERHKGNFEPIISGELYHQVQHILSRNRRQRRQYSMVNADFPLRRFVAHPNGGIFSGGWSQGRRKKYPYYICHNQKVNVRKEALETVFQNWLSQFHMDIVYFKKLAGGVKRHLQTGIADKELEQERLNRQVKDLKSKQSALVDKNLEGIVSDELFKDKNASIEMQLYAINQNLSKLSNVATDYVRLLSDVRDVLLHPGKAWARANILTKIKLQWFYFPDGVMFDGKKIRTAKICRLFKLKGQIFDPLSYNVHHLDGKSNTSSLQVPLRYDLSIDNTSSNDVQGELFWKEVGEELEFLASLVQTPDADAK
jgi:site-specific DNA recombinase